MGNKHAEMRKYLAPRCMAGGGEVNDDDDDGAPPSETPLENSENPPPYDPLQSIHHSEAPPEPSSTILPSGGTHPTPSASESTVGASPASTGPYDAASNRDALQAAMEARRRGDLIAGVTKGLQQIAQARGVANGLKPDYSAEDAIAAQGAKGVQEAAAQRQAAIQDFLAKRQMGRQDTQDTQAAETHGLQQQEGRQALEHRTTEYAREDEANDSNSKRSKVVQGLFAKTLGDQYADDLQGMSAADLNTYAAKPLELKAKLDEAHTQHQMLAEATRNRLGFQADKLAEHEDTAFQGKYEKLQQERNKAAAKLDDQERLTQQAAQSGGGIAGALVKGGALHEALGRVSQGELGMAVDPSLAERAKRLWGSITEGKSLTDKDVQEFQAIQGAARQTLDGRFNQDRDQLLGDYDRHRKLPGYAAGLVGYKAEAPHNQAAAPAGAPNAPQGASPQEPDVAAYAQKHNLSYEQAMNIKTARTGGH